MSESVKSFGSITGQLAKESGVPEEHVHNVLRALGIDHLASKASGTPVPDGSKLRLMMSHPAMILM